MRFLGLLPKLSNSLLGYLLPPLKNRRQGEEESEPMVGDSLCSSAPARPLGVMIPDDEGGDPASMSPIPLRPSRGLVAIGLRLGLNGGSEPAIVHHYTMAPSKILGPCRIGISAIQPCTNPPMELHVTMKV